jgi:hypothetical protein
MSISSETLARIRE